jgi:hypothetical protein
MGYSFVFGLFSFFHFYPKTEFSVSRSGCLSSDMRFDPSAGPLELGHSDSIPDRQTPPLAEDLAPIF